MSTKRVITLSDVLRHHGDARVVVQCQGCPRLVRFAAAELAAFYGPGWSVRGLRFRCDHCAGVGIVVRLEQRRRPEPPKPPRPLPPAPVTDE